jgi:hypothetical protein
LEGWSARVALRLDCRDESGQGPWRIKMVAAAAAAILHMGATGWPPRAVRQRPWPLDRRFHPLRRVSSTPFPDRSRRAECGAQRWRSRMSLSFIHANLKTLRRTCKHFDQALNMVRTHVTISSSLKGFRKKRQRSGKSVAVGIARPEARTMPRFGQRRRAWDASAKGLSQDNRIGRKESGDG